MYKERHILLKLVLPALVINIMNMGLIHAADDSTESSAKNTVQTNDMSPPPAGPYRSLYGDIKEPESQKQMHQQQILSQQQRMHEQQMLSQQQMARQANPNLNNRNLNNRQWTPPTPPRWEQKKDNQKQGIPNQQQVPTHHQQMAPQAAPNFNNRQWAPPAPTQWAPPQWNQQQRRPAQQQRPMQQQMAPQAVPNFNSRQWMPPAPPQWNQQQRRPRQQQRPMQQQMAPHAAPNFNNRQWTPPQWNQQRPVMPQTYTPYPQNRRW